jgi:hypothetical protein
MAVTKSPVFFIDPPGELVGGIPDEASGVSRPCYDGETELAYIRRVIR